MGHIYTYRVIIIYNSFTFLIQSYGYLSLVIINTHLLTILLQVPSLSDVVLSAYRVLSGQRILFTGSFCLVQKEISNLVVKHGATVGQYMLQYKKTLL